MSVDRVKQIWVDADAIPNSVKEILFRAATREKVVVTLVANQWLKTPPSPYIKTVQVLSGFDEADNEIVRLVNPDDLVITADIPLADEVLEKGGQALNPRGYYYDLGSIKAQLTMRDFNETLRASGIQTKGPDALSARDRQDFANALDRWLRDYFRVE